MEIPSVVQTTGPTFPGFSGHNEVFSSSFKFPCGHWCSKHCCRRAADSGWSCRSGPGPKEINSNIPEYVLPSSPQSPPFPILRPKRTFILKLLQFASTTQCQASGCSESEPGKMAGGGIKQETYYHIVLHFLFSAPVWLLLLTFHSPQVSFNVFCLVYNEGERSVQVRLFHLNWNYF